MARGLTGIKKVSQIMKSHYIVFPEPGRVEVHEEDVGPPGPGQILCAAQSTLVSIGTELSCLRGIFEPGTNWADWVQYPFRPGYSMAARVLAVGPKVDGIQVGDRVTGWFAHQQFFQILATEALRVPEAISDEEATWASLAGTTQLAVRRAHLQLGETAGVIGLGMLGQLVVQYLFLSGARQIIAIDPVQRRLDAAMAHGATHSLPLDVERALPAVRDITSGRRLDVVFDVTGHPAVLASSLQLVRKLGRVILLGDTPTPSQQHVGPGLVSDSIAILGIHGTMTPAQPSVLDPWTRNEIFALFFDYVQQGRMRVSDLITSRHSPAAAPEVYASLVRDRSEEIGVIFDWALL